MYHRFRPNSWGACVFWAETRLVARGAGSYSDIFIQAANL
jgi:hypothetical protein